MTVGGGGAGGDDRVGDARDANRAASSMVLVVGGGFGFACTDVSSGNNPAA